MTDLNEMTTEIYYNVQWQSFPVYPQGETL